MFRCISTTTNKHQGEQQTKQNAPRISARLATTAPRAPRQQNVYERASIQTNKLEQHKQKQKQTHHASMQCPAGYYCPQGTPASGRYQFKCLRRVRFFAEFVCFLSIVCFLFFALSLDARIDREI